jgi:hypothetical protein
MPTHPLSSAVHQACRLLRVAVLPARHCTICAWLLKSVTGAFPTTNHNMHAMQDPDRSELREGCGTSKRPNSGMDEFYARGGFAG